MDMKKIIYITSILFATFVFVACNDQLDQEPKSAISPEYYLNEETQLESYVNGLYVDILPSHGTWHYGTFQTDRHTDNQAYMECADKYIPGEWKVRQTDGSNWYFRRIYDCNYFLDNVLPKYEQKAVEGSDAKIRHFIGEVYFLRAHEYFKRYQLFGDFPIVEQVLTDNLAELVEASKRMPRNEVARFILSDLDKAIDYMQTKIESRKTRINKESAMLLKSRVALYEGTFLKYFKGSAFVPLGDGWPGASRDYNKSYSYPSGSIDNEIDFFLSEAIAAAKQVADGVILTENTGLVQQDASEPANPFMDMYASVDLSGYAEVLLWREYNKGLGVTHGVSENTQRGNLASGVTRGMTESFLMANGLPIYSPNSGYEGDDYISTVRAGRDSRLTLFLKEPGQRNVLWTNTVGVNAVPIEPVPNLLGADASRLYSTGYTLRKGNPWDAIQMANNGTYTGSITFRGVEALLNYIEAYYEKNNSLDGTARQYWQAIRERARVDTDIDKTIGATDLSKEAPNDWGAYSAGKMLTDPVLYNIRRERRCEMMAEALRWMDLQRWRSLDQMITTPYHIEGFKVWGPMQEWYKNSDGSSQLVYGLNNTTSNVSPPDRSLYLRPYEKVSGSLALNGYRWTMAHYLYPIAIQDMLITSEDNQLDTSPIYQNPGWPSTADAGALE
ncbi:MAG: RagB/SusD family nutrient uptake outer membrane protein [Clostridiales bacterium]|nr:RagB/SusD family nutrient uptake outer membrane protein [Clostridiales bacterium]